ncbi:hypothetical protein [Paenalcaligenes sp.]|uniref:SecDF P1 head subdomain-containing protein n=1 Tax=Paenalcaligenes sp. TaxID=1966342 RepID=UPI00262CCD87|nr:hypothetical protein [Paenalcaligenes sp.]
MPKLKTLSRLLVPVALMALAACQTPHQPGSSTASTAPATTQTDPAAGVDASVQAPEAQTMAPLMIFLADTKPQADWAEIQLDESNTLYMEPDPFLTRNDLSSVEAGTAETGEGLLALTLNETATQRLTTITQQNPGKRLALVVDGTLLAIPGYSEPITEGRLIFMVGSKENAVTAAQIIAGQNAEPM